MEVRVLNGQSLFDLAVQEAGDIEAVFDFAGANAISITDELVVGTVLVVPAMVNKQVADYYRVNGINPATALNATDAGLMHEGIDFWFVEFDFIVS
jgi:hypothetical protein